MVQAMDAERMLKKIKHDKSLIDFLSGAGGGLVVSCLLSENSPIRTVIICIGIVMLGIGFYKKASYDKKILHYLEQHRENVT